MNLQLLMEPAHEFEMLGDPVRLSILWHLSIAESNVTELVEAIGKRQQAISHHLTMLKLRCLVTVDRRGKSNYYSLTATGREMASIAAERIALCA